MLQPSPIHRPRRKGEWTDRKAVTFIVTLAASRNVTLAALRAGMSRKSAYALRNRDAAFAAAWDAAYAAGAPNGRQGDKVNGVHDPRFAPPKGDSVTLNGLDARRRDLFFANLANRPEIRRAPSSQ